jgi:hypothetical protein
LGSEEKNFLKRIKRFNRIGWRQNLCEATIRNPSLAAAQAELERVGIRDVEVAYSSKHPRLRFRINGGPLFVFAVPGTSCSLAA